MPQDVEASYARLLSLIGRRNVFPAGAPMADWAYHAVIRAQILVCDLDSLREVHGAIGRDALTETLLRFRRSDLFDVIGVLDPYAEIPVTATQETLASRVADLAGGRRPAFPPVDARTLDLKAMRKLRTLRGEDFDAWLGDLRDAEAKSLVRRIDPWLPGVRNLGATDALARLSALAEGCGTVPDIDLSHIDLKGLRSARRLMGDHTFAVWASRQGKGAVKAFVKRVAHGRKGTKAAISGTNADILLALAEGRKPSSKKPRADDAPATPPESDASHDTKLPVPKRSGRSPKRTNRKSKASGDVKLPVPKPARRRTKRADRRTAKPH